MRRRSGPARISAVAGLLLLPLVLIAAPPSVASPTGATISLGATEAPVEIVRCHLAEGRIVVRYGGRLHVLHAGDALGTTGLRLVEVDREAATFVVLPRPPATGRRLIRVTASDAGAAVVRELSTDPADVERSPAGAPLDASRPRPPTGTPDGG